MPPYQQLIAWKHADRLAHIVYDLTAAWPSEERYGLISQARRAAFSVPANICEGAGRRGRREFGHFLDLSLGSLAELRYTLSFARERGWVSPESWNRVESLREETSKTLWFLYRAVRPPITS
jgi:four helix bundle protein